MTPAPMLAVLRQILPSPDAVREAERLAPALPPDELADYLRGHGHLTKYQAAEWSEGRGPRLVVGSYVLLDKLGEGGMGEVLRARHSVMKREVALKRILARQQGADVGAARFRREVEAASKLHHENVIHVYDAGEANGCHFLTMELIDGANLEEHLGRLGSLAVDSAVEYVRQACVGMQHAHERGLVHRDLKPANLMLTRQGQVKILDLGLALIAGAEAMTLAGGTFGTVDYIAPEQAIDSHGVDVRADVYSLGCSLYHLLAGVTPFCEAHPAARPMMHLEREPTPVERRRPEVPAAVAAVVRKMMAKKREERYQTPGEAARALAAVLPRPKPEKPPEEKKKETQVKSHQSTATHGPPESFLNGLGMRFMLVGPGSFAMGSPPDEEGRRDDEAARRVTLTRPFYLAALPVTQRQYEAVLGANPSYFSRLGGGRSQVKRLGVLSLDTGDFPVEHVSWFDALEFITRLNARARDTVPAVTYRLPTEAEWEYACRGGPKAAVGRFHFDRPCDGLAGLAKYGDPNGRTEKAGSYPANVLGLRDMHGNVYEWCADWYGPYPKGEATDPKGPAAGHARVGRGGGFSQAAWQCRAAARESFTPETRSFFVGFRLAADVAEVGAGRQMT